MSHSRRLIATTASLMWSFLVVMVSKGCCDGTDFIEGGWAKDLYTFLFVGFVVALDITVQFRMIWNLPPEEEKRYNKEEHLTLPTFLSELSITKCHSSPALCVNRRVQKESPEHDPFLKQLEHMGRHTCQSFHP